MSAEEKNKLDELFKQRLGNPDSFAEYNDQDWDDLEQLLDAGKSPRGVVYWLPRLGAIAAVLLLFLGWWMFQPAKIEVKPTVSVKQNTQSPVTDKPDSNVANNATGTVPTNNSIVPNTNNTAIAKVDVKKAAPVAPLYVNVNHNTTNNNKTGVKQAISGGSGKPVTGNAPQQEVLAKVDDKTINKTSNAVNNPVTDDNKVSDATTAASGNVIASANTQTAIGNDQANKTSVTPVKKTKASALSGFKPQFGLAIMASPDINGVSSFQNAKIGTNLGLLLSVGVTKKLTISTGAAYSKKPYLTDFADYYASYKFKTDPQNVYADCRVLDIPLNVDYKLYSKSHNSFSVGSGLSSYLMLKEKYTYNYAIPGTAGPASYTVTNKNRHYFGVLNLNATYEHQLNTKFSIAAQPYLKVPLTDIGNARVKLQSAGIAFGVRWNINNKSITP